MFIYFITVTKIRYVTVDVPLYTQEVKTEHAKAVKSSLRAKIHVTIDKKEKDKRRNKLIQLNNLEKNEIKRKTISINIIIPVEEYFSLIVVLPSLITTQLCGLYFSIIITQYYSI